MNVELPEKRYYSIGEVAKAFDVNASLIRFWEKEFKNLSPKKSSNGKRKFTSEDIIIIKQIFFLLKEKGYTIEGAKAYIREAKKKPMNSFEIIEKLNEIKSRLLKIKKEL
ncbi:MerR family transcriptional regulator [Flavobacteriaceae bacterium]|jgi:DNA-binding transcriptional MerR regulator|nr:MerR family transcriptional regulator [Flavobacteriaceae bacterium]|tara:strand:- start:518 stop:847 length:330 start_codon:yes stop_codon:yes gene_type:complete